MTPSLLSFCSPARLSHEKKSKKESPTNMSLKYRLSFPLHQPAEQPCFYCCYEMCCIVSWEECLDEKKKVPWSRRPTNYYGESSPNVSTFAICSHEAFGPSSCDSQGLRKLPLLVMSLALPMLGLRGSSSSAGSSAGKALVKRALNSTISTRTAAASILTPLAGMSGRHARPAAPFSQKRLSTTPSLLRNKPKKQKGGQCNGMEWATKTQRTDGAWDRTARGCERLRLATQWQRRPT